MEWQPIETAPKDGRAFLAVVGGDFWIMCWERFAGEDGAFVEANTGDMFDPRDPFYVTHWQPLPEPPK